MHSVEDEKAYQSGRISKHLKIDGSNLSLHDMRWPVNLTSTHLEEWR